MRTEQHRKRLFRWKPVSNFGKTDSGTSLLFGWVLHQMQTFQQHARFLKQSSSKRFSQNRLDFNS